MLKKLTETLHFDYIFLRIYFKIQRKEFNTKTQLVVAMAA